MSIWAVSHELFGATNHGLPVAQLHDGDWLIKAGNNEVQMVKDAHPATPITWGQQAHGVASAASLGFASYAYGVAHINLPNPEYLFPRLTPPSVLGSVILGGAQSTLAFPYHMVGHVAANMTAFNNATMINPDHSHSASGLLWPKGPVTEGLYWLSHGIADNPPATTVHWDRLDGRQIEQPRVFEYIRGAWVERADVWPAPGAPFNQGAMAQTHGWVWDGTTWQPLGRHAAVWTGSQWVSP
jgi:hypothetical protein